MSRSLASRPMVSRDILGRRDVLTLLDQHMELARKGSCQIITLAGEAGIGKSRIVAEAKARAARSGMAVLEGCCFEPDHALPYAPFLDLFRAFMTEHSRETLEQVIGTCTLTLDWLLPELAVTGPDPAQTVRASDAASSQEPGDAKLTLFESVTLVFNRFATNTPLLLVFEDLHWSDDISLELLLYAVRRLTAQPVLVLLTYRSEEPNPGLNHLMAMLDRTRLHTEIMLTRLTSPQVDLMIRSILELERPVPSDVLNALYNVTEGNPFFVEEALNSLVITGELVHADGHWNRDSIIEWRIPRSIQEMVQRRVRQLGECARRALTVAAVAGREFDFVLLQRVLAIGERKLVEAMKELVAAQLVVDELANRYSFRHALIRLAVYDGLLRRERQTLHREIAQIQEQVDSHLIASYFSDLSYHFFEGGAWEKALEYSRRGGEQALELYAPHQAAELFTRAVKSAQSLLLPPSSSLYHARGQAYETIGDLRAASTDYAVALAAAREAGDTLGQWQSLIDLGSLSAASDYSKAGGYFQQALELARANGNRQMLAHSLNRIGNWHTNLGAYLEAIQYHEQAREIFQQLNDPRGLAHTLDLLGLAHYDASDLIQGTAHMQESLALSRGMDDRASAASSLATMALGGLHYHSDTVVLASNSNENVNWGEEALKLAREMGWRSGEAYALLELALCYSPRGAFARALESAQTALEIAEEIDHTEWLAGALCALGAVELDLLDLPSARQHLERALAVANQLGSRIWLPTVTGFLAHAYVCDNDISLAETVLDAALGSVPPSRTRAQRLCWCARAECALHKGDALKALEIADKLIAATPQCTPISVIPRLWSLRARALAARHHYAEAQALLQAAQETAYAQGAFALLWRLYLDLGDLYRTQSLRDEASTQSHAARRIVQDLAAAIPDQPLREDFAVRATSWIPRGGQLSLRQSKKSEYSGLTAREREVASLIALGKSNRDVAAALVVTERTVGAHVGSILSKLGLTSRTQIAAWAIERGLKPPR